MAEDRGKIVDRLAEFARAERARTDPRGEGIHLARNYHSGVGHVEQFRSGFLPRLRRCGDLMGRGVLDVGAGAGFIAALLATTDVGYVIASGPDWQTISPRSPALTNAYRSIAEHWNVSGVVSLDSGRPDFNGKRLALVQAGGARLPFLDGAFDIVYTHGCLEHFDDLESVFADMLRVLRPGGLLYCESEKFWGARDGSHLHDVFPAPWAHLLASADELWERYAARWEGRDILWPGRSVDREFFVHMLTRDLNRRGVRPIRKILLASGCDLVFWQQISRREDRSLLRRLRIREALLDWPLEELLTSHLAFGLRKRPARFVTGLLLRFPWTLKEIVPSSLRRLLRRRL